MLDSQEELRIQFPVLRFFFLLRSADNWTVLSLTREHCPETGPKLRTPLTSHVEALKIKKKNKLHTTRKLTSLDFIHKIPSRNLAWCSTSWISHFFLAFLANSFINFLQFLCALVKLGRSIFILKPLPTKIRLSVHLLEGNEQYLL